VDVNPIPQLGSPAGVFDGPTARGHTFTWAADEARPGLADTDVGVVLSVRSTEGDLSVKTIPGDTQAEFVTVEFQGADVAALWIDGTHELLAAGSAQPVVAERVLIWESGGVQYRLEADVDLAGARELAAWVEGGTDLLQPG